MTANTATKQFERALDRAWTQINVGGMDYTTAIRNAITDLGKSGIGSIEYKSGRIDNIEVAVRRAVVTGANQTAMKTQEVLADELGVELVEVTAHGGARPEHAKWQGKVFSRNGRVTIDGVTYEDLRKATGYGRADGLGGINCRHNFHPYVPGTSRAYSDKGLAEVEKKKVEYNGEVYTEYEASQIQRRIERDIRAQKRTIEALEAGGQDASAERAKLRDSQKEYTDFTNQTGIRKQSARTEVANIATKSIDKSQESDIIKLSDGKIRRINNVRSSIEQRNTSKGNPNAILQFDRPLNNRQQALLDELSEYDKRVNVKKNKVNMKDLSALTAYTGDEFAMFTIGNQRMVIRGNANSVNVDIVEAKKLNAKGYKWSGHTHPGINYDFTIPSQGDKDILKCFKQNQSVIYNSKGQYRTFEKED